MTKAMALAMRSLNALMSPLAWLKSSSSSAAPQAASSPRHHLAGRKKLIVAEHRIAIRQHLKRKPDLTLAELREQLGLNCTLPAIHYVLVDMGLTYKKRRSAQPNRSAKTSVVRGGAGSAGKAA